MFLMRACWLVAIVRSVKYREPITWPTINRRTALGCVWGALASGLAGGLTLASVASGSLAQTLSDGTATTRANVLGNINKPEKTKLTIAVSNKAALCYLPLTIAEHLGYFKAEGLDIDITEVGSTSRALQALGAGSADIVSGWFESVIAQHAKKETLQAFVLQGRAPQMALGVSTKTLPEFQKITDLKGKKVGIVAPGTPTHTVAHAVLARAGFKVQDLACRTN
jgi:ABC-type nitrate/sulfonate/bicarbonate transport system substrate-binding protein